MSSTIESIRETMSQAKPLPLKQRTSSQDARRDYTHQTWLSLLRLLKPREYLITVDNFSIWRRHLAWAFYEGSDLRGYISQRYASSMVFMSLLLGAVLNVLFNSDNEVTQFREMMRDGQYTSVAFWAGLAMLVSIILTILSIISTFTAWGMVNAISDANAHCILRSSIGQYAAELPSRFIVASIYCFMIWMLLICVLLLPKGAWGYVLVTISLGLFVHVVTVFSAFGRIIMHSGAMSSQPIFDDDYERGLLPHGLHSHLLQKARTQLESKTSIMRQYRYPPEPLSSGMSLYYGNGYDSSYTSVSEDALRSSPPPPAPSAPPVPSSSKPIRVQHHHRRHSSTVRFADTLLNSSTPVVVDSPLSSHEATSNNNARRKYNIPRPPLQQHGIPSNDTSLSSRLVPPAAAAREVSQQWLQQEETTTTTQQTNTKQEQSSSSSSSSPPKESRDRLPSASILYPSTYTIPKPKDTKQQQQQQTTIQKQSRQWPSKEMQQPKREAQDYGPRKNPHWSQSVSSTQPQVVESNTTTPQMHWPRSVSSLTSADEESSFPNVVPSSVVVGAGRYSQPQQQQQRPRKYFDGTTTKPSREGASGSVHSQESNASSISDTAAMAANDAIHKIFSTRPPPPPPNRHQQQQQAHHAPKFSTDEAFFQEYGHDIFEQQQQQQQAQQQQQQQPRTGGIQVRREEEHPLLRNDTNSNATTASYDAVGYKQQQPPPPPSDM